MRRRSPDGVINALLAGREPERQGALLDEAAALPEVLHRLMERAQAATLNAPGEALRAADFAVTLAQRQGDFATAAAACRIQAQALRTQGRHADALPVYERAAEQALRTADPVLAARVQIGRIDSLGMLGRIEEALQLADRLEATLRAGGEEIEAAKVLVNAGSLHYRRDAYAAALDCYERARQTFVAGNDPMALARAEVNCANALVMLNRAEEAVVLFERSRVLFAEAGLAPIAAMVDADLGFLHHISGRHTAALAAYTRARLALSAHGQPLDLARCDADMADIYRALNLRPEALEFYTRAIRQFETVSVDYERGRAELGQAAVLLRQGRVEEAAHALDSAEAIFRAQKNAFQRAQTDLMRASLHRSQGRNEAATALARRAAARLRREGLRGWAAEAEFLLADADLEAGRNAARRMSRIAATAQTHRRGWLECRAKHALGRYHLQRGAGAKALNHLRAAVETLEALRTQIATEDLHVAFLQDKQQIYDDLIAALLERGRRRDISEALECIERSRSRLLLERTQTLLDTRPRPASADIQNRLAELRARLSREYYRLNAAESEGTRRLVGTHESAETLTQLEKAYQAALREQELQSLEADVRAFAPGAAVTVEALQRALCPNETLLAFYTLQGNYCAFLVRRESVEIVPTLAPVAEVAHAIRRMRYHLKKVGSMPEYTRRHGERMTAGMQDVLRRLYDLLMRPLAARMNTPQLRIVPHGLLHGIPFHAMHDGERYALDRWEIAYAPSASFVTARASREETVETGGKALLMGIPAPGIERVAQEVVHLAELLPDAELRLGEQATLQAFHAFAPRSRRIHLATHALFREDNPLFSGLRFADGWLLAYDLYTIPLDCELVTLSACRTGVSTVESGDELFGLLRGFLAAGARSLAVSLWPADDAATTALMERFYTFLEQGLTRAGALRQAQRALREQYPHPYHWGAFLLVGER